MTINTKSTNSVGDISITPIVATDTMATITIVTFSIVDLERHKSVSLNVFILVNPFVESFQ